MDNNAFAVFLSIGVYTLYVLIPLIPSVYLYKKFPDTRVTAEGEISNWKIKAGGAFAAYLVVVLIAGNFLLRTQEMIEGMAITTWTVYIPKVVLQDKNGQTVPGHQLIKTLDVKVEPDVIAKTNYIVDVKIPSEGVKFPTHKISFSIPNFGEETIDLENPAHRFKRDKRRITFLDPIVIKEWPNPAGPTTYQAQSLLAPSTNSPNPASGNGNNPTPPAPSTP